MAGQFSGRSASPADRHPAPRCRVSCRDAPPLLARSQHRSRLALSTDTRALSTDLVRISMRCCNFVWCCFVASTCRCIDRYLLWPPCVADVDIIFSSCGFFDLFSSPNLSRRRLDARKLKKRRRRKKEERSRMKIYMVCPIT